MNCTKCGSDTKVIDRRGTKRRRECLTCNHRFSTVEVLWERKKQKAEKPIVLPVVEPVATKTVKQPKKSLAVQLKKNASARRKIEDLRDSLLDTEYDCLDFDHDYLPDKW